MGRKRQAVELIRGHAVHRRTEGDYMAALIDTVTLEDWRDVVAGALQLAKGGDAQARAWLAQYLVGKASASAPIMPRKKGSLSCWCARDSYGTTTAIV